MNKTIEKLMERRRKTPVADYSSQPETRNWIVMTGQPLDTTKGGGFEFFGPYTENEAKAKREEKIAWLKEFEQSQGHNAEKFGATKLVLVVQLLK